MPEISLRKSPRLPEYDYAQPGAYFITVCTDQRKQVLGIADSEEVILSSEGDIVHNAWLELPEHYQHIELDEFVIMPNHIHGIVWIKDNSAVSVEGNPVSVGARHASPLQKPKGFASGSLSSIVASFKSAATKRINQMNKTPGAKFWQRSFYDHIIRDEDDLYNHRKYIQENPRKWSLDKYYQPTL